jgi:hypothetical protein
MTLKKGMLNYLIFCFLEKAGELRIIILRSKNGKEPIQHTLCQPKGKPHGHKLTLTPTYANSCQTPPNPLVLRIQVCPRLFQRTTNTSTRILTFWMGAVKREIPRALAKDHSCRSSLVMIKALAISGAAPSKTHLLRWVHTVYAPRIMRELIPCNIMSLVAILTLSHQSKNESSVDWGERDYRPTCDKKRK